MFNPFFTLSAQIKQFINRAYAIGEVSVKKFDWNLIPK